MPLPVQVQDTRVALCPHGWGLAAHETPTANGSTTRCPACDAAPGGEASEAEGVPVGMNKWSNNPVPKDGPGSDMKRWQKKNPPILVPED